MGTSRLPSDMPFGYNFDDNANYTLPSPPIPAPGPSLLDDNESNILDIFFNGVGSETFDYDILTSPADGSSIGLGWDQLPPTFMGTSSSYGQQQPPVQTETPTHRPPQSSSIMPGNLHTHATATTETSPDVLAAATLLQNGSNALRGLSGTFGHGYDPLLSALQSQLISPYATMVTSPLQHQTTTTTYAPIMEPLIMQPYVFGTNHELPIHQSNPHPRALRFGSDLTFGTVPGVTLANSQMESDALERQKMPAIDAFFPALDATSTADNTRAPTPAAPHRTMPSPRDSGLNNAYDDVKNRPRKRRKSKFGDNGEEFDPNCPGPSPSQRTNGQNKRRSAANNVCSDSPQYGSSPGHKRRKSSIAAATAAALKAGRENLTEGQKRENHIKSEQKRRQQIKDGFEDLNELVPGLKPGGFSKSAVLTMAADWLEELLSGNEALRGRLEESNGPTSIQ